MYLFTNKPSIFWDPKRTLFLSASKLQAAFKCELPQLELNRARTFLAIKHCERTKNGKVLKLTQISSKKLAHII